MIIEFTGPSGSGKTETIKDLLYFFEQNNLKSGCILSSSLNSCEMIPSYISDKESQNYYTDLYCLPYCFVFLFKYPTFFIFSIYCIIRSKEDLRTKVSIFRGLIRKTGTYMYLNQRKFNEFLILVDEGIIHSAHNFLVSSSEEKSKDLIRAFANLCPLPDSLIYIDSSKEIIIERLIKRGDLSPRIKSKEHLRPFVENAINMYSTLIPQLKKRLDILEINTSSKDNNVDNSSTLDYILKP